MNTEEQPAHRTPVLDALRGLAVLAMIVAHAIFFFHDNSNPALTGLQAALNMTVFTIFVFVSGLTTSKWLDSNAHLSWKHVAGNLAKRSGILYGGYAATALVAILTVIPAQPLADIVRSVPFALALLSPPNFTEYIPLFIILTALLLPFRALYRWTRQSILLTFITGAFSYLVGTTLYPMVWPPILGRIKELFAGGGDSLRFPILFYLPVYLWGIWWQHHADHSDKNRKTALIRLTVMLAAALVAAAGVIASSQYQIPIMDPATRWPPSIAYLALGMSAAAVLLLLLPSIKIPVFFERLLVYFGRDAFDLWISHLLILFVYRRFIGVAFADAWWVTILTVILVALSTIFSSFTLTNTIAFHFTLEGSRRFRKRYLAITILTGIFLVWLVSHPSAASLYGNRMLTTPLAAYEKLPPKTQLIATTDRSWYVRRRTADATVQITLRAVNADNSSVVSIHPDLVTLSIGGRPVDTQAVTDGGASLLYVVPTSDLAPGIHQVRASVNDGASTVDSPPVSIAVSEPLLVAWTFDWEGWDAPDSALTAIDQFSSLVGGVRFTHFVSPRTFLDGVTSQERKNQLVTYLLDRHAKGDELALHLHMHYDLVSLAGVTPKTAVHWGLRSSEGYDVPTSQYSATEFRQIVEFARTRMQAEGLPQPTGYRAGGWFISSQQLSALSSMGFSYDSSGRDRPTTGAFVGTPWNLPAGAQPFVPNPTDQNLASQTAEGLLEIPNNGASTYESSTDQIRARLATVYPGGVLTEPKVFVVASHPQFASREFSKIPEILATISDISQTADAGPAVFVTMSEIYSLWKSFLP